MKTLPIILFASAALAAAAVAAEDTLTLAIGEREQTLDSLRTHREQTEETIRQLLGGIPAPRPQADTSLPEQEGTETVAVADSGMLFDSVNSRIIYINNVRVADPRLQMRCSERLFIHFPNKTQETDTPAAKKGSTTEQQTAKESPAPAEQEATQSVAMPAPAAKKQEPLCVEAAIAMVDAVQNIIYLEGKDGEGNTLVLTRGQDELKLTPANGKRPTLLADTNGDILISAGVLDMKWYDSKGSLCTLHNENGPAYYKADEGCLYLHGTSRICTAHGTVETDKQMALTFVTEDVPVKEDAFMGQFLATRIRGVKGATANGGVHIHRPAAGDKPASVLHGDKLAYNGLTGDTTISGSQTSLTYGEQTLRTNESLHLAENGDITLTGSEISGSYNRPDKQNSNAPIVGEFRTTGQMLYTAANHTIVLPNGIETQDSLSSVRIGGRLELLLQPDENADVPDRQKTGMLNLAIAGYKDIAALHAIGGVDVQYKDTAAEKGLTLVADTADIDRLTAEITLTAEAGKRALLEHDSFSLAAESAGGQSTIYLAPNGDITTTGEKLHTAIPDKGKLSTVDCTERMVLTRAENKLLLGPNSRTISGNNIITARGDVHLLLAPGPEDRNKPLNARYPHLVYNFDGLKTANTANGGTLQTEKASLSCNGAIHVEMKPQKDAQDDMAGIRRAIARGNVAILGKDSTGRLLRAKGDVLTLDGNTGHKELTGRRVLLQDQYNTHIATGKGARVVLDKKNNARVLGEKQQTVATHIHEQVEKESNKEK